MSIILPEKVENAKEDIILSALLTTSLKRTQIPLRFMRRRKASAWLRARKFPIFACSNSTQFLVIRGQSLKQTHFFFYRRGFGLLVTETGDLIREIYFPSCDPYINDTELQTLRPAFLKRKFTKLLVITSQLHGEFNTTTNIFLCNKTK